MAGANVGPYTATPERQLNADAEHRTSHEAAGRETKKIITATVMKESFILYTSYYDILEELTDEQFGQLMRALFVYARDGEAPQLPVAIKMAFAFIRDDMDRNQSKYEKKCARNKQIAIERERKKREVLQSTNVHERAQTCTNVHERTPNDNGNENENENGNENENDNENDNDSQTMREGDNNTRLCASPSPAPKKSKKEPDYVELMDLWNSEVDRTGSKMRHITRMTPARKSNVLARFRENENDEKLMREIIVKAASSDFMNGNNPRSWIGTFDWLMMADHFQNMIEGSYDNKPVVTKTQPSTISKQIEEQRERDVTPQKSPDEKLKEQLKSWVRLVNKNPRSSVRKALEEYERRGELQRLGVIWEPLLHQHSQK